jgi:hypothetical protein
VTQEDLAMVVASNSEQQAANIILWNFDTNNPGHRWKLDPLKL